MSEERKVTTTAAWKKNAEHVVCCPSGTYVTIRIPDLPAMISAGALPQHLLEAAVGAAKGNDEPSAELIKQQHEFTELLVQRTVVQPKLSEEDLADIPYEDKDFLVAVATRQRDIDAEGEHIGGLTKSEKFRRFRGIGEFEPTLEDL